MLTIFTIGHSNHPIDRFLELLTAQGIEELVDIRRFPGSRAHPHFNRHQLADALASRGLAYCWIEALGGRRRKEAAGLSLNSAWRNASFRNYADYMGTAEFREGIEALLKIAAQRRSAIMCAEGLWWQCHRRLVSDFLTAGGVAVEHIFPNGQTKPQILTPGAVIADGQVTYPASDTLFD